LVSYSTATIELYTLSLHHALPISRRSVRPLHFANQAWRDRPCTNSWTHQQATRFFSCPIKSSDCRQHSRFPGLCQRWRLLRKPRSEEHTSELQSRENLVCRLLLEK